MSVSFKLDLSDLYAGLRAIEGAFATSGEAADIVEARGERAFARIYAGYPVHSGDLKRGLKLTHTRSRGGARSTLTNTSKYAAPFDIGSQVRHDRHGHNRGSAPANPLFSRTMSQERRGMNEDFRGLLTRLGLQVSGDGTR